MKKTNTLIACWGVYSESLSQHCLSGAYMTNAFSQLKIEGRSMYAITFDQSPCLDCCGSNLGQDIVIIIINLGPVGVSVWVLHLTGLHAVKTRLFFGSRPPLCYRWGEKQIMEAKHMQFCHVSSRGYSKRTMFIKNVQKSQCLSSHLYHSISSLSVSLYIYLSICLFKNLNFWLT